MRIALGYQSRVGKDTFAYHVAERISVKILSFAEADYDICSYIQHRLNKKIEKDASLLQFIGEGMRQHYENDVWANLVINDIKNTDPGTNIIVTDMRYINEYEKLKSMGFVTIKIVKPDRIIDRNQNHASELELENMNFDYIVHNDSTLDEFKSKIDILIAQIADTY